MTDLNSASFENLVDSCLNDFWVTFPHEATFAGIHKYDAELDPVDKDSRNNFLRKTSATLEKLKDFKRAGHLNDDHLLDLEVDRHMGPLGIKLRNPGILSLVEG